MYSIKEIYKIGNGPSSSHTMGPKNACLYFMDKYQDSTSYKVTLYGSLALTGKGHLTDYIIKETLPNCEVIFDLKTDVPHPNTMVIEGYKNGSIIGKHTFYSIGGGNILIDSLEAKAKEEIYKENSFKAIKDKINQDNISLIEYIDKHEDLDDYLKQVLDTMFNALKRGLNKEGVLPGKLGVTRKAKEIYFTTNNTYKEDINILVAYAYAISEENASGGMVVTAPTCGACGVLPAVVFYLRQKYHTTIAQEIAGLKVAGLIGNIVSYNASISGAYAGCQAEVGTATSMAAAYVSYVLDGTINKVERSAEIALEHNLGLTCDPVAGYVQIPCIERNALGALRALDSALIAKFLNAGEAKITFDTVVNTMLETGLSLPRELKETAEGGLAKHYHEE